mgnify:FL=1
MPPPNSEILLQAEDLSKSYSDTGDLRARYVIRNLNLAIRSGESVAVFGPSGSGKSTLFNLLGGLDHPDSGTVTYNGRDLAALGERDLATLRNNTFGYVFTQHHLLPQCTVMENVLLPLLAGHVSAPRNRARGLLAAVCLDDRTNAFPHELNDNERQRAALARAAINQPSVFLADEPTGMLDDTQTENLCRMLMRLQEDVQAALVVMTHDRRIAELMGRTVELKDGALS